jgi:hypothetical protein
MSVMSSSPGAQPLRPWEEAGSNVVGFLELTDSLPVGLGTAMLNQQQEEQQQGVLSAHHRRITRRTRSRGVRTRHGSFLRLTKHRSSSASADQVKVRVRHSSATLSTDSPHFADLDQLDDPLAHSGSTSYNTGRRLSLSVSSPISLTSRSRRDSGSPSPSSSSGVSSADPQRRRKSVTTLLPSTRSQDSLLLHRARSHRSRSDTHQRTQQHSHSRSPSSATATPSPPGSPSPCSPLRERLNVPSPPRRAHSSEALEASISGSPSFTRGSNSNSATNRHKLARRRTQPNMASPIVQWRRGNQEERAQAASARVLSLAADLCSNGLESSKASHLALTSTFPGLESETLLAMLASLEGDTALLCEWLVMKGWGQGDE